MHGPWLLDGPTVSKWSLVYGNSLFAESGLPGAAIESNLKKKWSVYSKVDGQKLYGPKIKVDGICI